MIAESGAIGEHIQNRDGAVFMRRITTSLAIAFALVGSELTFADDALVARGLRIAEQSCVKCHAVGADDSSRLKEAPPFRTLGQGYEVENLAEALAEGMVTGHAEMPEIKLEPDDIDAFIAYLMSIQVSR